MRKLIIAAAVIALPAFASAATTNLLVNGSFENGLNGWTRTEGAPVTTPVVAIAYNSATSYPTGAFGEAVHPDNAVTPSPDAAGQHAAYFVDDKAKESLSQTVALAAGTSYDFGFDAYLPANGYANAGDAIFTATLGTDTFANFMVSNGKPTTWTHFSGTLNPQLSSSGAFAFTFSTNKFPSKDVVIDRVYLTAAVPEPETYALMLGGLAALGFIARSRKA